MKCRDGQGWISPADLQDMESQWAAVLKSVVPGVSGEEGSNPHEAHGAVTASQLDPPNRVVVGIELGEGEPFTPP